MSPYEIALLVFAVAVICILLWDNHKIRGRLERSEADIVWLKACAKNTVEVHQRVMDGHTRAIERLDEQTGKIAQAGERFRQSQPDFTRLRADMDRLLKADYHRDSGSGGTIHRTPF